jgi:hypothetical protein
MIVVVSVLQIVIILSASSSSFQLHLIAFFHLIHDCFSDHLLIWCNATIEHLFFVLIFNNVSVIIGSISTSFCHLQIIHKLSTKINSYSVASFSISLKNKFLSKEFSYQIISRLEFFESFSTSSLKILSCF